MAQPVTSLAVIDDSEVPRPRVEPPLTSSSVYTTVSSVRSVVNAHDRGDFSRSSLLIEQMLWNPRLRAVSETRLNGFMSTAIRWEPGRSNAAARRAAKAIAEDWPLIAPVPMRKQLHQWGLLAGVGLAQKHWYRSSTSGRLIPRLQVYHPRWALWDWEARQYALQTYDNGVQAGDLEMVDAPSLTLTTEEGLGLWVVHEPFGAHSWRFGLMHAAWYAWLGHDWASRDQSRASEKLGIGMMKAKYPVGAAGADHARYLNGLRNINAEGVIPCPVSQDGTSDYDVETLEYTGTGYDMIHRTKDSKAIDLAILFLGHNLTTEAKGGSYAAANVGDLIRGDIKAFDAEAEAATFRRQVLAPWALANFDDDECAPIPVYETDPPAINLTAAQTLQALAQATQMLAKVNRPDGKPYAGVAELLTRFRVPANPEAEGVEVEPPAPIAPPPMAPEAPPPTTPPEPTE